MSARATEVDTSAMWAPDPLRQRLANHTMEDVLLLPDDAPRTEVRDGMLVGLPWPTFGHQEIVGLVWFWLRGQARGDLVCAAGVGVAQDARHTFEPDLVLVSGEVSRGNHFAMADQVVLAVEVVCRGTEVRDRIERLATYAHAGIPFYWRVEQNPVHVYAYELGPDGTYQLAGDSDTELVLARPFDIRLAIGDITP